jgi:hypothetical protein
MIDGLAAAEKINSSYVSHLLRLTLLAPISSRRSWMDGSRRGSRCRA